MNVNQGNSVNVLSILAKEESPVLPHFFVQSIHDGLNQYRIDLIYIIQKHECQYATAHRQWQYFLGFLLFLLLLITEYIHDRQGFNFIVFFDGFHFNSKSQLWFFQKFSKCSDHTNFFINRCQTFLLLFEKNNK